MELINGFNGKTLKRIATEKGTLETINGNNGKTIESDSNGKTDKLD